MAGVLVAISIPIFTSQLEKAKEATDLANLRAAKAEAVVTILDGNAKAGKVYYNATSGTFVAAATDATKIGKGTDAKVSGVKYDEPEYTQFGYNGASVENQYITATYTVPTDGKEPSVTVAFSAS